MALSDPKHNDSTRKNVEQAVSRAILNRIRLESIDKNDFASWIASLPLPLPSRNHALRMLRLRQDEGITFADRLQQAAGEEVIIETELTLDDITKWFVENPEGTISRFLEEQEENIIVTEMQRRSQERWSGLGRCFVIALLRSDTPEGNSQVRDLIQQIWNHTPEFLGEAIQREYVQVSPGRDFSYEMGANNLPEYILDLLMEGSRVSVPQVLALCDSPKAGEILEKWVNSTSLGNKPPQLERYWEIWKTRHALRQKKMEVFQELLAGKISPDDLLFPTPSWIWTDGEYVQQ
jgi:hypothetical protein